MIAEKYGVGRVIFEGDEHSHPCVQFGDGMTRIFTSVWDKNNVGVKIAKTVDDLPAFSEHDYDENNPPHKTDGIEIHLLFDNLNSIDALISSLEYIKDVMTS